ncbi:MAG TPA: hypothetical protein VN843_32290 [Anaerolineales bacterium]|nr:hypothetical protein [Anaerolineales bacterium]
MEVRVRALHDLKDCLNFFLVNSADTNWKATRDRVKELLALIEPRVGDSPAELYVAPFEAGFESRVKQLREAFEATFASEAQDSTVFSVSQKGTHSTLDLMERAYENLSPEVRSRLSSEIKTDIAEAGRCLALDCHTASGYHILRAVERLIVKYLDKVSGTPHKSKSRNWGVYIDQLRKLNADASVTGYLDHIRRFYRNPLIHPEATLTGAQAFDLFNACLSAISQLDAAIEGIP